MYICHDIYNQPHKSCEPVNLGLMFGLIRRGSDLFRSQRYGYYGHANHYWHMLPDPTYAVVDECLNQVRDLSMHNASYTGPVRDAISLSAACADPESDRGCYEEHLFKERVLEIIREHKVEEPLFLVYAFHLVHVPLQVPKIWLHEIDHAVKAAGGLPFDSENRRLYAAMTLYMDYAIGKVVEALKNKGMYEDTLVIFASDNGGSIDAYSGGSNYPLRGGKVSDWEGGLRTNAFVSGGFVPESRRGTKFEGVINIADWYGTLTELAGVEMKDHRAEAANVWLKEQGLPLLYPVESVPQWQNILQNRNGRPWPIHLSTYAVMMWPYKLVIAQQPVAAWTGPVYPNCSTLESVQSHPAFGALCVKVWGSTFELGFTGGLRALEQDAAVQALHVRASHALLW